MRSMTGFGRGECRHGGFRLTIEVASVNRKQADVAINLPRELEALEPRVREAAAAVVARGRLNVAVTMRRDAGRPPPVKLDESLARAYVRGIEKMRRDLKLAGEVTLDAVLRCPGVLRAGDSELDPSALWPSMDKALRSALDGLLKMREKEGFHLAKDLGRRLDELRREMTEIGRLAPAMVERHRKQLHERIRQSGVAVPLDDERLLKEVAFFADRSDVTEELTRLESHLEQFRESLRKREPVGRTLEFLTQEIHREVNTIGSKSGDAAISRHVVAMKGEVEKIREQVQNIE